MKYLFISLITLGIALVIVYTTSKFSESFGNVETSNNSNKALKGCMPSKEPDGNCYPLKDVNNNVLDYRLLICPQRCQAGQNSASIGNDDYCQRDGDCREAEPSYFYSNQCESDDSGCCSDGYSTVHPMKIDPADGRLKVDYTINTCPVIKTPSKCESTMYGCCADGITVRTSNSSCPSPPPAHPTNCSNFIYGCCQSDGRTPSNTQNQLDSANTCPTGPPFYPTVPLYDLPMDNWSSSNKWDWKWKKNDNDKPSDKQLWKWFLDGDHNKKKWQDLWSKKGKDKDKEEEGDDEYYKKGISPYYDPIIF
jgi:hypothetical protein